MKFEIGKLYKIKGFVPMYRMLLPASSGGEHGPTDGEGFADHFVCCFTLGDDKILSASPRGENVLHDPFIFLEMDEDCFGKRHYVKILTGAGEIWWFDIRKYIAPSVYKFVELCDGR